MSLTLPLDIPQKGSKLIGIVHECMKEVAQEWAWQVLVQGGVTLAFVHIGHNLEGKDEIGVSSIPLKKRATGPVRRDYFDREYQPYSTDTAPFNLFYSDRPRSFEHSVALCLSRDDYSINHVYNRQRRRNPVSALIYEWERRRGKHIPLEAFGVKDSIFTIMEPDEVLKKLLFYANAAYSLENPSKTGRVEDTQSPQFRKIRHAYDLLTGKIRERLPAAGPYRGLGQCSR